MIRQCCKCNVIMGEKEPFEDKSITHGLCPKCVSILRGEIEAMEKGSEKTMPETKESHNVAYYELLRETSKYNKYMRWHVKYYLENKTLVASDWFKTEREAQESIETAIYRGRQGFPIGKMLSFTEYRCIGA